ncbi:MAG TPA: lysophospholipid acyltransferase family protein [Roseiflexaceae bacterium]|nr:lysophospholipid acyltransferase family protein [Roseiflexaceae bacterium]
MPSRGLAVSYRIIRALIRLAMLLVTRTRVFGRERVPRSGAALVVSNHISAIDPVLLVGVFPRPLVMMSKIENARGVLKLFMRLVGAFTVRRGKVDREALRIAEEALAANRLLCLFPEGTRSGAGLTEAHGGAALLATRANVPIVPVAITGTTRIFNRRFPWLGFPQVTVTIGESFQLPATGGVSSVAGPGFRRDDRERMTDEIMRRIAALLPPEMRGRYSHR